MLRGIAGARGTCGGAAWLGAAAAIALGVGLFFASAARAQCGGRSFVLTTSPFFESGSGARLSANEGLYPSGTVFPATISGVGGQSELAMESVSIPDVTLPFAVDVFSFEIVEQGVATGAFRASLDPASGAVNPDLADPPLEVRVSRSFGGMPAGSGIFSLHLTSGDLLLPPCGESLELGLAGEPLDPATGALVLVGGFCIEDFDGEGLGMYFQLKLAGVLSGPLDDADRDGVPDAADNCLGLSNASQLDTNGDGYGNACDADYNNDGVVGGPDFLRIGRALGATIGAPNYHPDLDLDGDGVIGAPELLLAGQSFAGPPGPAAASCD